MDTNVQNCSQNSFDWSEFDEALDLEQPPAFSSTLRSLEITNYPSQLILSNRSRNKNSKDDSGFNAAPSASFTFSTQSSVMSFEGQHRSPAPNHVRFNESDSGCSSSPIACTLPAKKSRFASPVPRAFSSQNFNSYTFRSPQNLTEPTQLPSNHSSQTDEDSNSNDTAESDEVQENEIVTSENADNVNDPNGCLSDPIHLKISPILNLMSQIKTEYSDYAFVYALAAHMCKDIYPRDCHISLKTALLLSIVSCTVRVLNIALYQFIE